MHASGADGSVKFNGTAVASSPAWSIQLQRCGVASPGLPFAAAGLALALLQGLPHYQGCRPVLLFDHSAFVAHVLQAVLGAGALPGACGCAARHRAC